MSVLELDLPLVATEPPPRSLEDAILRALHGAEAEPCPVCGGPLGRIERGVACGACGSRIEREAAAAGAWVGGFGARGRIGGAGQAAAGRSRPARGKSGHRRAGCWLTASGGNPRESATETTQPRARPGGNGEKVR